MYKHSVLAGVPSIDIRIVPSGLCLRRGRVVLLAKSPFQFIDRDTGKKQTHDSDCMLSRLALDGSFKRRLHVLEIVFLVVLIIRDSCRIVLARYIAPVENSLFDDGRPFPGRLFNILPQGDVLKPVPTLLRCHLALCDLGYTDEFSGDGSRSPEHNDARPAPRGLGLNGGRIGLLQMAQDGGDLLLYLGRRDDGVDLHVVLGLDHLERLAVVGAADAQVGREPGLLGRRSRMRVVRRRLVRGECYRALALRWRGRAPLAVACFLDCHDACAARAQPRERGAAARILLLRQW